MKPIIYCTNIHSERDASHLLRNIEHVNALFNTPLMFVSSNGIDNIPNLPPNVHFKKFRSDDSYITGPINSTLNSLKMASESFDGQITLSNYDVIFSHPDLYVCNIEKLSSLCNYLGEFDCIFRNYTGPGGNKIPGVNYYLTEDILISGKVLSRFSSLPYDPIHDISEIPNGVHEIMLAHIINNVLNLKVKKINVTRQVDSEENEMGFYHDHPHYVLPKEVIDNRFNNLGILTHTHSECADVQKIYFAKFQKYFNDFHGYSPNHYVLTNQNFDTKYGLQQIVYDEREPLSVRILLALEQIKEDFVLFSFEDYILYDYPDFSRLGRFMETMQKDSNISFIRLIQSGIYGTPIVGDYNEDLAILSKEALYYFTTQATIWRKDILKRLFTGFLLQNPQGEINCSQYLASISTVGLYVKGAGRPVGPNGWHNDSLWFPYCADAIKNKKWNVSEYPVLLDYCSEFGIDINIRGMV